MGKPLFLLEEITEAMKAVDLEKMEKPEDELQEGRYSIGILPPELQRLWAVCVNIEQELGNMAEQAKKEIDEIDSIRQRDAASQSWNIKLAIAADKEEVTKGLFWTSVRYVFPELANKKIIGVTKNFEVYWQDGRCRHPLRGAQIIIGPRIIVVP